MASKLSMEWSVDRFNKFLNQFVKDCEGDHVAIVKEFMKQAVTGFVGRTPVDTGRARAGWSAAAKALGVKIPSKTKSKNTSGAFDPGIYEEKITKNQVSIRVVNTVPYIGALEYGWSKQAPLGMVRITLAELRNNTDLSSDLMDAYQANWNQLKGAKRYKMNAKLMRDVVSVKNTEITRKSKPIPVRSTK